MKWIFFVSVLMWAGCGDFENACDLDYNPDLDCDGDGIANRFDPDPEVSTFADPTVSATKVATSSYLKIRSLEEVPFPLAAHEDGENTLQAVAYNHDQAQMLIMKSPITSKDDGKIKAPLIRLDWNAFDDQEKIYIQNQFGPQTSFLHQSDLGFFSGFSTRLYHYDLSGTAASQVTFQPSIHYEFLVMTAFRDNGQFYIAGVPKEEGSHSYGKVYTMDPSTGATENVGEHPGRQQKFFGASTLSFYDGHLWVLSKDHSVLQKLNLQMVVQQEIIVPSVLVPKAELASVELLGTAEGLYLVTLYEDVLKIRGIEVVQK